MKLNLHQNRDLTLMNNYHEVLFTDFISHPQTNSTLFCEEPSK